MSADPVDSPSLSPSQMFSPIEMFQKCQTTRHGLNTPASMTVATKETELSRAASTSLDIGFTK